MASGNILTTLAPVADVATAGQRLAYFQQGQKSMRPAGDSKYSLMCVVPDLLAAMIGFVLEKDKTGSCSAGWFAALRLPTNHVL